MFVDGIKFRLSNVWAPEKNWFGWKKATRIAAGMTRRTKGWVSWFPVARDKYGRQVGKMSSRHGSINLRMRRRGYEKRGR